MKTVFSPVRTGVELPVQRQRPVKVEANDDVAGLANIGHKQAQLSLYAARLGNVEGEIADRVGFEGFLCGFVSF